MDPAPSNLKPEWLREKDAARIFGLSPTTLYRLRIAGEIRTTLIRRRNSVKGIRLYNFDSLAAHMEKSASGGQG